MYHKSPDFPSLAISDNFPWLFLSEETGQRGTKSRWRKRSPSNIEEYIIGQWLNCWRFWLSLHVFIRYLSPILFAREAGRPWSYHIKGESRGACQTLRHMIFLDCQEIDNFSHSNLKCCKIMFRSRYFDLYFPSNSITRTCWREQISY